MSIKTKGMGSGLEPPESVNITFCKDCKYWKEYRSVGGWCEHLEVYRDSVIATTGPYDYCSHGIRRKAE